MLVNCGTSTSRRAVGGFAAADIGQLLIRVVRSGVAHGALVDFGNGRSVLCAVRSKMALPRSCAGVSSPFGAAVAVGAQRNRFDERDQVVQFLAVVALATGRRTFRCAGRTRFPGSDSPPFHLKGAVSADIFEQPVIDDVLAETVRLQVPLKTVEGRLEVAVGAAEVALEGESRAVEEAFAAPFRRQCRGSAQRKRAGDAALRPCR